MKLPQLEQHINICPNPNLISQYIIPHPLLYYIQNKIIMS